MMGLDILDVEKLERRFDVYRRRVAARHKIGPEVDRMMAEVLKKQMRRKPVGKNYGLGASLMDVNHPDHIFKSERIGGVVVFTIGTRQLHSYPYQAWRKSKGMKSHFRAMPAFRKKVGKKVADYIMNRDSDGAL